MERGARPVGQGWLKAQAEKEASGDVLKSSERNGQLVAVAGFLVVIAFIAIHQSTPTGFFTGESGTVAAAVIYVMLAVGIVPVLIRFISGRKNQARFFEAVGMVFFFVGQMYLLAKFPFDFAHFADPLPESLEFLLDWISATLAKVVLGIGIVGGGVFFAYTLILYNAVKKRLQEMGTTNLKTDQ